MKTIVLHDYFATAEGGGKLSLILAQGLNADLGYGFRKSPHPFFQDETIKNLQYDLKANSIFPLWKQLKLSLAFSSNTQFLKNYENVIYSGFYAPLAVKNHPYGSNTIYCHTPPRFIYDQRDFYINSLPVGMGYILSFFVNYLQPIYERSIDEMDLIITNSENTKKRIKHFLNKDSIVVHPPCDSNQFSWQGQGNYYLSTARLDPLKRVDLVIKAFLKMPHKNLIVASGGTEFRHLRKLANHARNIEFTGWVSNQKLANLVGNSIATIYLPKDEDFGMSPVESMAAGKPVIGVREGGLLETVISGKTGLLVNAMLSVDNICEAVDTLDPQMALGMRYACEARAKLFDRENFLKKIRRVIFNSRN